MTHGNTTDDLTADELVVILLMQLGGGTAAILPTEMTYVRDLPPDGLRYTVTPDYLTGGWTVSLGELPPDT